MDFLVYLQQVAKLSDRQVAALQHSDVNTPTDLRSWSEADLDDLLHGSDPEHYISSRNRARLACVRRYIQQKHKLVPGKTQFCHILDVLGDDNRHLDVRDDDSSSVFLEVVSGGPIQEVATTTNNSSPKRGLGRRQASKAESIGWGYASTSGSSSNGDLDYNHQTSTVGSASRQQPPKKSKRGGRRTRKAFIEATMINHHVSSTKYSSGDLESVVGTQDNDSATEASGIEHHQYDRGELFWENHPYAIYGAGCLALSLGLGVGAATAMALTT